MPETIVDIKLITQLECDSLVVAIYRGEVARTEACQFRVSFDSGRGGKTLLFGKVIDDKSPQALNTVTVISGEEVLARLSYNDIVQLPHEQDSLVRIYHIRI